MIHPRRALSLLAVLVVAIATGNATSAQRGGDDKKPSLSLKADAARRLLAVPGASGRGRARRRRRLRGLLLPAIEWDWGDGTVSGNSEDCDPYQAGKSTIRRRYSIEHVFRQPGTFQVFFRLKQRDRVIAASSGNVQVRPGVRDEFGN